MQNADGVRDVRSVRLPDAEEHAAEALGGRRQGRAAAAGDRVEPRRRRMPIVREICGLSSGRVTRKEWSSAGVAVRGSTEIPRPASPRPSEVERCALVRYAKEKRELEGH
jgi:hypothetical protein